MRACAAHHRSGHWASNSVWPISSDPLGQPGLQLRGAGGGGVDRAPWLDPPPPQKQGLNGQDPQNPTETDPRASEVT